MGGVRWSCVGRGLGSLVGGWGSLQGWDVCEGMDGKLMMIDVEFGV